MRCGVSSDQEVRENAARTRIPMLAAAFRVTSESSAGRSPYRFAQRPINRDSQVFKEAIHKIFTSTRTSCQCGKDGGGHGYIAALCRKSARSGTPPSRKVKSPALSLQEKRRDKGRGPLHLHRFVVTRLILTPAPDPASSSPPSKIHRYSRHSPGCRACRTSRPFRSNFCGWRS